MTREEIKLQLTRRRKRDTLLKDSIKYCESMFDKTKDKDWLKAKKRYKKELKELENEK